MKKFNFPFFTGTFVLILFLSQYNIDCLNSNLEVKKTTSEKEEPDENQYLRIQNFSHNEMVYDAHDEDFFHTPQTSEEKIESDSDGFMLHEQETEYQDDTPEVSVSDSDGVFIDISAEKADSNENDYAIIHDDEDYDLNFSLLNLLRRKYKS